MYELAFKCSQLYFSSWVIIFSVVTTSFWYILPITYLPYYGNLRSMCSFWTSCDMLHYHLSLHLRIWNIVDHGISFVKEPYYIHLQYFRITVKQKQWIVNGYKGGLGLVILILSKLRPTQKTSSMTIALIMSRQGFSFFLLLRHSHSHQIQKTEQNGILGRGTRKRSYDFMYVEAKQAAG